MNTGSVSSLNSELAHQDKTESGPVSDKSALSVSFSALTLLVGRQEGHPTGTQLVPIIPQRFSVEEPIQAKVTPEQKANKTFSASHHITAFHHTLKIGANSCRRQMKLQCLKQQDCNQNIQALTTIKFL